MYVCTSFDDDLHRVFNSTISTNSNGIFFVMTSMVFSFMFVTHPFYRKSNVGFENDMRFLFFLSHNEAFIKKWTKTENSCKKWNRTCTLLGF